MSADTADGVLLPIISGTARPTAAVTVRVGSRSVTVTADSSGTWGTEPIDVQPGEYAASVEADGLTATPVNVTVTAPVLSLSRAGNSVNVTVHGTPRTEYALQIGSHQPTRVTTNARGTAHGTFAAPEGEQEVQTYAINGQRTGPTTTITIS